MVRRFTFLALIFWVNMVSAQQSPQYTMYMLNQYAFNPAYAGMDNSLNLTGVYRAQWVGLLGSPVSQQVNAHMPLYFLRGGAGISVSNDMAGPERNTTANIGYNYWVPISETSVFSIGAEAGIIQKTLDGSVLRTPGGTFIAGEYVDNNDKFLPSGIVSALTPNVNVGMYYKSERMNIGLSVNNLTQPKARLDLSSQSSEIVYNRNYFLTLGLNFDIGSNWTLQPGILAKSDLVQTELHFSTIIRYNDNIFGGASFRGYNSTTVDALALLAGLKLNERVTLSYSYDLTLSALNAVSRGSHEILLNYNLNKPIGKGRLPKIIYNPRYE